MPNPPDDLGVLGKELDGRYRIDRLIGAGTMGSVYQGTQLAVGRPVAIKLLHAAMKSHQEIQDRFRVEAQAIATLTHPNCVTLYDFGYSDEVAAMYMAVEYLDGESLDSMIQTGLPALTALALARQIAEVLAVAHKAGIMHRDLKPENVMVIRGSDGAAQAKVLDFGLARIFEYAKGSTRLTRHGQLFGTPAYMSPEQCHSAMEVGPPADVYALGVSMFEMLTGRLPFESPSVPELLVLHSTKTAPPVAAGGDVPLEISALIARMLAKDAADRPTAVEAAEMLGAVLEGRPIPALPAVMPRAAANVVASQPTLAYAPSPPIDVSSTGGLDATSGPERSNDKRLIALGAGLLVVFLAAGAALWPQRDPPTAPAISEAEIAMPRVVNNAEAPTEPVVEPAETSLQQTLASNTVEAGVDEARAAANKPVVARSAVVQEGPVVIERTEPSAGSERAKRKPLRARLKEAAEARKNKKLGRAEVYGTE